MKRFSALFALLLVASIASPVVAQQLGVTAGISQSDVLVTFGGNESFSYPDRRGITAGLTYRKPLRSGIVLQPELLFVQRGWAESEPTLSLTYVEVPMLLRFGALSPQGARFRPVFSVGPSISLLVHCGLAGFGIAETEGSGCNRRIVRPFAEDYGVRRIDAGAVVGLGAEARLAGGTIVGVEARYELGLLDIRPGTGGTSRNTTFFIVMNVVPGRSGR